VPEEHGVGHRPQEQGAGQGAGYGEGVGAAGGDAGGDEPDEADQGGDDVEPRRELRDRGRRRPGTTGRQLLPGHGRHPAGLALLAGPLAGDAGLPAHDRHREGHAGGPRHPHGSHVADRHRVHEQPGGGRPHGQDAVHRTEQPAVADADFTPASGDPEEEEAAGRPLQEDGRGVESDHAASFA
jgi:hypothetical protein